MKNFVLVMLVACSFGTATAQNLGQKYDWIKTSYEKIPLRANLPYYDTSVAATEEVNKNILEANAMYYFDNIISASSVDVDGHKICGKGSYTIYTSDKKDEEHTYTVNYSMDITIKDGKYRVAMHDFGIYYLTNKVEFKAKYKHAEMNDGKSNYFMALFNDQNKMELKKLARVMSSTSLPNSTASK